MTVAFFLHFYLYMNQYEIKKNGTKLIFVYDVKFFKIFFVPISEPSCYLPGITIGDSKALCVFYWLLKVRWYLTVCYLGGVDSGGGVGTGCVSLH